MGSNLQKSRCSKIRKALDIRVFYMSSNSAMGPHFFHWKNKLWHPLVTTPDGSIGVINFYFFRHRGLRTWRPAQTGPGGQNRGSKGLIRWKTLESHNSKQMMVYGQITFFFLN